MKRCIIVGAVPENVLARLSQAGLEIVHTDLNSAKSVDAPFIVIDVPTNADQATINTVFGWLKAAGQAEARAGITSVGGMTSDVWALLMDRSVRPVVRPLNIGRVADEYSIGQFVTPDDAVQPTHDIPLGRFFPITADAIQYRLSRQLSLPNETMQTLQDAVSAMQAPFPNWAKDKVTSHKVTPPWDPNGQLTRTGAVADDRKELGPNPSLADVLRRHDRPDAIKLLHPGISSDQQRQYSEWTAPKLLIRGDSGSGKTLVAQLVADLIRRSLGEAVVDFPFQVVNCASLSDTSLDHELFGSPDGQHTGVGVVVGILAKASYGVAFFDEIGDLPLDVQRGLLVYLQDGMVRPFGMDPFPGFTRVIAATNRELPLLIDRQQFRNDLRQRFDFEIVIPSLAERSEQDMVRMVEFAAINPQHNTVTKDRLTVTHIDPDALKDLSTRKYEMGNFRELETVVHQSIANARRRGSKCIRPDDVPVNSETAAIKDSGAHIIDVAQAPEGRMIDVTNYRDMQRLAAYVGAPSLRTADGAEYVVANNLIYRYGPSPIPPAETDGPKLPR